MAKKKKAATPKKKRTKAAYESVDIFLPTAIYTKFTALDPVIQKDILRVIFDVHQPGDHVFKIDKVEIKEKTAATSGISPMKVCTGP